MCNSSTRDENVSNSSNTSGMDFETLENCINEDLDVQENIERSDETEEINAAIEVFRRQERNSYLKIDTQFGNFLESFVLQYGRKEKQKLEFKEAFFWFIMGGFFILLLTPFLIIVSAGRLNDSVVVVSLISVLVELVSAIIVLPKIIAEYLFNKEEDNNMMEIIKNMQEYNEKKHDHIEKKNS